MPIHLTLAVNREKKAREISKLSHLPEGKFDWNRLSSVTISFPFSEILQYQGMRGLGRSFYNNCGKGGQLNG